CDVREYFQSVGRTVLLCEVLFYFDDLFTYFSCGQKGDKVDLVIHFRGTVEVPGTALATALPAAAVESAATAATVVATATTAAIVAATTATAVVTTTAA